jgi:hypothetical protein
MTKPQLRDFALKALQYAEDLFVDVMILSAMLKGRVSDLELQELEQKIEDNRRDPNLRGLARSLFQSLYTALEQDQDHDRILEAFQKMKTKGPIM